MSEYYYCIGVEKELSVDGEIYFLASGLTITDNGDLVSRNEKGVIDLAVASGQWKYIHSASVITGDFCSNVEHWKMPRQCEQDVD